MVVTSVANPAAVNPALQSALCVGAVTGGEETNPLWTSEVDSTAFRGALSDSLANQGLLSASESGCSYRVDSNLLGLNQPIAGLDMEVTANVNYKVIDKGTGDPYLQETVSTPFTASFGSSLIGIERLRIANEGAVRTNIQEFLRRLTAYEPEA